MLASFLTIGCIRSCYHKLMPRQSKTRSLFLSPNMQLAVGFVIPTVILLFFSSDSRLGPLWAMVLALVFPFTLELYSLSVRRKPSYISIFAILGILMVGAISLLGLSKEWLAIRRSIVYVVAALGLFLALYFKPGFVNRALTHVMDMDTVHAAAEKKGTTRSLARYINRTSYIFALLLLLIGVASYGVTMIFITAPTGSSEFNAQYAELRVLSLLYVSLPFLLGATALLVYLVSKIEKLTGIDTEELLKKKK